MSVKTTHTHEDTLSDSAWYLTDTTKIKLV